MEEEKVKEKEATTEYKSKGWTDEDIANLTLAIVKFPPGTGDRWGVIAGYIGMNQKETITKAKEIQLKKQQEVENRKKEEQELKEKLEKVRLETEKANREKLELEKKMKAA